MNDETAKLTSSNLLHSFNLPHLLAGPAGNAISRLIAGATDYPVAWLERASQSVKDGTQARKLVREALAKAAAAKIGANEDLVDRAMYTFLSNETCKQHNRERVAQKTIEHLGDTTEDDRTTNEVDPDWMNVFEQHAAGASSERLQDLWGRVLAGEIRRPSSFSLRTIAFIAQLDRQTAAIFERQAGSILGGYIIPQNPQAASDNLDEFLHLQETGLLTGVGGQLHRFFGIQSPGRRLSFGSKEIRLYTDDNNRKVTVPGLLLTQIGREIAAILSPTTSHEDAERAASTISKDGLTKIALASAGASDEAVIWTKTPT